MFDEVGDAALLAVLSVVDGGFSGATVDVEQALFERGLVVADGH